jgi:signal transduction histidine kinase
VEAHGGRIWIKKKNTPGATIAFTVPLVPVDHPAHLAKVEE